MKRCPEFSVSLIMIIFFQIRSVSESLTFESAVSFALQKNHKILQCRENVKSKKYDMYSAFGMYGPQINVQGSYNKINSPLVMNLDPIRDALIALQSRDQINLLSMQSQMKGGTAISEGTPQYSLYYAAAESAYENAVPHFIDTLKKEMYPSASITIVQPLFSGMRITAGARAARAEQKGAMYELEKMQNDIVKETIVQCISLVLVNDLIKIRDDLLSGMQKHLKRAEAMAEQGMIAKYNLLRARVAVADAERNLFEEQNRYEMIQMVIRETCRIPDSIHVDIRDKLVYKPLTDSLTFFWSLAEEFQPILKMIKQNRKKAQCKVTAMQGTMMPQLSAFGKYELFKEYLSDLEPAWIIGVQASMPIFNGGKNLSGIQSAKHLVNAINQIDSAARNDLWIMENKAYRDMQNSQQRYERLNTDLELAKENLRQCQSRFESGFGTSLEVIDAQLVLEKNRIEQLTALCDYCKAVTELYYVAGKPESALSFFLERKNP